MKYNHLILSLTLVLGLMAVPLFAVTPPIPAGNVMFVVNDPAELTFVDMGKLINYTKDQLLANKSMTDRDLANFWEALREHGAPEAGNGANQTFVGMVVSPDVPSTEGLVIVKGNFDKEKVLELISRRYSEHMNEHVSTNRQKEMKVGNVFPTIAGYKTDKFALPLRNRELHIVDMGDYVIFASHKAGSTALLLRTIRVLEGEDPVVNCVQRSSKIVYSFEPSDQEREQLLAQLDDAYNRYKAGRMENRRGIKRFTEKIRTVVTDKKYSSAKGLVDDLLKATFKVDRNMNSSVNGKILSLQLEFSNVESAQKVKASAVQHLVAEMKKPSGRQIPTALANPKITCEGKSVFLFVNLETEADQMHAFSVMAGYVARGILTTRPAPVVSKLKNVIDRQIKANQELEKALAVEKARTSFFSFGRKFGLMFDSMKIRSDIRSLEDAYVDLNSDPKVIAQSVEKFANASLRDMDILNKLIEARTNAYAKTSAVPESVKAEMMQLKKLKVTMMENGRGLVVTVRSAAFQKAAGNLDKKVMEKVQELAKKSGLSETPMVYTAGSPAGIDDQIPGGVKVSLAPGQTWAKPADIKIPEGTTLAQALSDYQNAYLAYSKAISGADELKTRESYENYLSKFQIYKALKDKLAQPR